MSVTVVGSIGIDDIKTQTDSRERVLGGSASYASYAINLFTQPKLIAVVGTDFEEKFLPIFEKKGFNLTGLEIAEGKTFRWGGEYMENFNDRVTHFTDLNVFADFDPKVPEEFKKSDFVFLANIDPDLQAKVLEQMDKPKFSIVDTMELWIDIKKEALLDLFTKVNAVIINDDEAKHLYKTTNLFDAARQITAAGPDWAIIKKGAHGVILYSKSEDLFLMPAYPVEKVIDPTGAGDSFAGALVGFLAKEGKVDFQTMKQACIWGTMVASHTIEDFSIDRLENVTKEELEKRYQKFIQYIQI